MLGFWTEGDAWKRLAWAKREATEELLEICSLHLRQRQAGMRADERE